MTSFTHRPTTAARAASTALLALIAALVLAGCSGDAQATAVRANGATLASTPVARKVYLVPPPSGVPPIQPVQTVAPRISARAAIVIDDATGAVLYDYNSRARFQPASLTKIATAALAIDKGKLDQVVTIDNSFDDPSLDDATAMGLEPGDKFTLRDLIYGMLLPSGADASIAIGRAVSGSDAAFLKEMNAFMESLGLYDTHFIDPHGLGGPAHLSTAYDMAMLSRYALRQPLFAQAAKTEVYRAKGSRDVTVYNTNPWSFLYEGGDGVKSGFTEQAGPTLSASATRNGHRVIVVVLGSYQRNEDTTALMDWAFQTFCWNDGLLGCKR